MVGEPAYGAVEARIGLVVRANGDAGGARVPVACGALEAGLPVSRPFELSRSVRYVVGLGGALAVGYGV